MNSPEFSKHIDNLKIAAIGAGMALIALTGCSETTSDLSQPSKASTTLAPTPIESIYDVPQEEQNIDPNVDRFVAEVVAPKLPELFEYIYNNPGPADAAERDASVHDQITYRYIRVEGDDSFILHERTDNSGKLLSFSYNQIIPGTHLEENEREDRISEFNPEGDKYLNNFYLFMKVDGKYMVDAVIDEKQVTTELIWPLEWGDRTYPGGRENNPMKALEYTMSMLKGLTDRYPEYSDGYLK